MLLRFIEHVRTKPKPVREQYAFAVALGFTGIIAMVWLAVLPGRFADNTEEAAHAPFAGLLAQVKEETGNLGLQAAGIFNNAPLPESGTSTTAVAPTSTAEGFADPMIPLDMENALNLLLSTTTPDSLATTTETESVMIRVSSSTATTTVAPSQD